MYKFRQHELNIRIEAVKLYRTGVCIKEVCNKYKVSKASLMRWNSIYDGT